MLVGVKENNDNSMQIMLIQFDLQNGIYTKLDTALIPHCREPELHGDDDQLVMICVYDKNMGVSRKRDANAYDAELFKNLSFDNRVGQNTCHTKIL
jgi:hypothetical protein